MANPEILTLPADEWTKVAEDVTEGIIDIVTSTPKAYFRTYRITGDPPPSGLDGVKRLRDGEHISAISSVDVYVFPVGGVGKVTVNL